MNRRNIVKSFLGVLVTLPMLALADTHSVPNVNDIKKSLFDVVNSYMFVPSDEVSRTEINNRLVKVFESYNVVDYVVLVHDYDSKFPSRLNVDTAVKLTDASEFIYIPLSLEKIK